MGENRIREEDKAWIKVDHVSKKFCKSLKLSMIYGMQDIIRNLMRLSSYPFRLRRGEFWALENISFHVEEGETVGIIGPNGAGKTTLLKLLNGIFWPDKGKITIKGRIGALIEIGAGFHPLLTGRENIYINGAILGMDKWEIKEKFDSIVNFAEIGEFLDTPVKYYSSGMFVRLGFSIAIHSDPDILLVDEVLAVGDAKFRGKCAKKMKELREKGVIIVLVSHDMNTVLRVCDKVIWLENARIKEIGKSTKVVPKYLDEVEKSKVKELNQNQVGISAQDSPIKIMNILLFNQHGEETLEFEFKDDLIVHLHYVCEEGIKNAYFVILVGTSAGECLFLADMRTVLKSGVVVKKEGVIKCKFHKIPLLPNIYTVGVAIFAEDGATPYMYTTWLKSFRIRRMKIEESIPDGADMQFPPITYVPYEWEI